MFYSYLMEGLIWLSMVIVIECDGDVLSYGGNVLGMEHDVPKLVADCAGMGGIWESFSRAMVRYLRKQLIFIFKNCLGLVV